jgi:short-subunit dehydrogenase
MTTVSKTCLITGASRGIGASLALALAGEYKLGLLARNEHDLTTLQKQITAMGGIARVYPADITELGSISKACQEFIQDMGAPDLVIANAGVSIPMSIRQFSSETFRQVYDVNVLGVVRTLESLLPSMISQKRGHIVVISSIASFVSFPGFFTYCSSKAAISAVAEGMRAELRRVGIGMTIICPGFIETAMTSKNAFKMPFLLSAERAAQLIIRAIKRRKPRYIFPWQMLILLKIYYFLPYVLVDRIAARMHMPVRSQK